MASATEVADRPSPLPFAGEPRLPAWLAAFSLLYFLAAKLGIATALPPEGIVIVWPPNAIVLVALLSVDRRHWWAFFIATVATEVAADLPTYPLWAAIGYGIVNFSEAAIAATLLQRFGKGAGPVAGVEGFARFVVIGPLCASGTAALFGAAIYKIGSPQIDYLHYWRTFWFGDALGLLVVGTSLLTLFRVPSWWSQARGARLLEGLALAAGLGCAIAWAFFTAGDIPRVYTVFPFLLWAAVRFGGHGASIAVLATIGGAVSSAAAGVGPFSFLSSIDAVGALQGLSVVVALSTFFLAFTIEDFWRANASLETEVENHGRTAAELGIAKDALERRNTQLDGLVAERTSDLQDIVSQNELLLKEMYHRVKNSLQIVSGMIALQSKAGNAADLRERVSDQISAIAATYDVMHRMECVEAADLCHVAAELCTRISAAAGDSVSVTCETDGEAIVPASTAVSLALALNELVTNSIKHHGGEATAAVHLCCRVEGGEAVVTITDNGPGFPAGFDVKKARGFGMRMVRRVVSQVRGRLEFAGSTVELRIPVGPGAR